MANHKKVTWLPLNACLTSKDSTVSSRVPYLFKGNMFVLVSRIDPLGAPHTSDTALGIALLGSKKQLHACLQLCIFSGKSEAMHIIGCQTA